MPQYPEKKIFKMDGRLDRLRIKRKDSDERKVVEDVFDVATLKTLYHLSNRGFIEALGGSISTGKEANVFYALGSGGRELAIKIYRISSSNFKAIQEYLLGDPRFEKVGHSRREVIFTWARKEFQNLKRAYDAGVRVPEPIVVERNVLVMEFIGKNEISAPQLRNVEMNSKEALKVFQQVVDYMRILYQGLDMVHGDLSEYNILIEDKLEPVIIDMGQGVLCSHPRSEEFLKRDTENLVRFFRKHGVEATCEQVLSRVKEER
jgi:RIO kinase 1